MFLVISLVTVVVISATESACPNIISRSSWGARQGTLTELTENPPPYVIIHHGNSSSCTTQQACSRIVKSFQNYHMDNKKWDDIGYNFVVGEDGNVYEGRGWGKAGAHAPNYNIKSIGICFIGSFDLTTPNSAAISAAKNVISCGVSQGKISANYKLLGHRQVRATDCPGNKLFQEIKKWDKWSQSP